MISSIGSTASTWTNSLFNKLDTQKQGYIDKNELQSAFNSINSSSSTRPDVNDLFEKLDSDSDGKITESEFTDSLKNIFSQAQGPMGMNGPEGTPPPPPPTGEDAGFTKDELTSQLKEIGSSDSKRSSSISNIVNNFEAADTNEDGKVTAAEAMAYDQVNPTETSSTASVEDHAGNASEAKNEKIKHQIMALMHAYQTFQSDGAAASGSASLSVTA